MNKNPFELAMTYLTERTDVEPCNVYPAWGSVHYRYEEPNEALGALGALTEMLSEHNLGYVELKITLTPYKNIVTLELGDEDED